MEALLALAPLDRGALWLVDIEGLSGAEAAAALGCSHDALRARLVRARRRLGSLLTDQATSGATSVPADPDRGDRP